MLPWWPSEYPALLVKAECLAAIFPGNLAPKFSKRHLIELLNSICPGKYDFACNRIDFRQNRRCRLACAEQKKIAP